MTLYDRLLKRLDRWDDRIDRDRDACARKMAVVGATPELVQWLDDLESEQRRHRAMVARFKGERDNPALLFPQRPRRQLKVLFETPARRRREA